jgi:ACS family sodium-dependent inorganic phosphate cotransporter-like MFS transporter 5
MFAGAGFGYAQRAGLPVAIVRMQSEFSWDKQTQGSLLSAFYLGYFLLQLPGAALAHRYGARRTVGAAMLGSSLLSGVLPAAASLSSFAWYGMVACRAGQGACQACLFPAFAKLWSSWAPPAERSRLSAFPQVGGFMGTLVFEALAGWQCDSPGLPLWLGGWEGVFLLHGMLGVAWVLLWLWAVHETPAAHPRCSAAERDYIAACLVAERPSGWVARTGRAPWGRILCSPAVLAICVANWANNWGDYVLIDGLPSYFRDVLGFDLATAGALAALPQLAIMSTTFLSSWAADGLRQRRLSTWTTRRLCTAAGLAPAAALLFALGVGVVSTKTGAVIAVITIEAALGLCAGGGFAVNHLDIAPATAGYVMSVANTAGQAAGWLSPYAIGLMTPYPGGLSREQQAPAGPSSDWVESMSDEWGTVFVVAAVVQAAGLAVYVALGQGVVQQWDRGGGDDGGAIDRTMAASKREDGEWGV